jgi:hypothetical protein
VRWTTFSIFHGQERWRSEGIQVGGVRSARGVFGNWFDRYDPRPAISVSVVSNLCRDYDEHGPAGPTSFWKVDESENPVPSLQYHLPDHVYLAHMAEILGDSDVEYEDDDADASDEEDVALEPDEDELPGLLEDAQMDIEQIQQLAQTYNLGEFHFGEHTFGGNNGVPGQHS